jgi:hypothetical protein
MLDDIRVRRLADALAYAVLVVSVTFALAWGLGVATGRGLVGAKWGLFVAGMTMLGYGALRLRVATPLGSDGDGDGGRRGEGERRRGAGGRAESGVLVRVAPRLLPERVRLPAGERYAAGAKLLLAAVLVLALSFVLEVVFGVGVPA